MSAESQQLDVLFRDLVAEAVAGTEWSPPEGGLITNVVVLIEWLADGQDDQTMSWYRTGSSYMAEGMLRAALRNLDRSAGRHGEDEEPV